MTMISIVLDAPCGEISAVYRRPREQLNRTESGKSTISPSLKVGADKSDSIRSRESWRDAALTMMVFVKWLHN
jgi:hypothetical protein